MLGLFKWFLIIFVVAGVGLGILAIALSSSGDSSPAPVELDLTAVRELANAASQDADNMERHAQTMASIAAARPDHAHWASEAELALANARSLRFIAEAARAIDRDEATFPVTASSIQLDRLLGNGLNLQGFGRTVVDHAAAMEGHVEVMRQQAAGDTALLSAISELSGDVQRMKADGSAAINHGKVLEDKARTIARSIGVELD